MRDEIKKALEKASIENPQVEFPANEQFGDYSTNAALVEARKAKKNPQELALEIIKKLGKIENTAKVEVSSNGFINFWLSKDYLSSMGEVKIGKKLKGKKIMVEFTDPNPFKEFHVGHLYSNTIGESISRILESLGVDVKRANYQGDVGLHVAKAIWGVLKEGGIEKVEQKPLLDRIKFLGACYAKGDKAYKGDAKPEIEELNGKIYKADLNIKEIYEKGRKWSLEYFEEIYKILGTKFDYYYFESEVGKKGVEIVKNHKNIFKESQHAVIFEGEKLGLHNRVFINSQGLPTYEAKELGLAIKKTEDFDFDESIVITGNEIAEYFRVVKAALSQIEPEVAEKTRHLTHGMVRTSIGKMSSRLGNVISFEELFSEVKRKIREQFSSRGRSASGGKDMSNEVAEKVALGSIKYAFLKGRVGKDLEFDLESSISLEGDSGPYLQYTFARIHSVLAKANGKWQMANGTISHKQYAISNEELGVLRSLHKFPEVVEDAASDFAPSLLTSYLFDLAHKFNLFYQKHRIAESESRLKLASKVGETLKNGLTLLGIEAPQKM